MHPFQTLSGLFVLGLLASSALAPNVLWASEPAPDVVRAPPPQEDVLDKTVKTTNNFIEKNLINTEDYTDLGIKYEHLNSCLRDFSCIEPDQQSLKQIIRFALSTAPQIDTARARYKASQAGIKGARWEFWPTPRFDITQRKSDERYVATVGLQQPLWTGGRLTAALNNARAQAIVAQSNIAITQLNLAQDIVQQYASWYAAERKSHSWRTTLGNMDIALERVKRLYDAGGASLAQVDQAQSKRDASLADLRAAEADAKTSLADLSQLIGTRLQADLMHGLQVEIPNITNDGNLAASQFLQKIYSTSPYIAKARAEVAVAESELRTIRAQIMPTVSLRLEREHIHDLSHNNRAFINLDSHLGPGLSYGADTDAAMSEVAATRTALLASERELKRQIASAQTLYHANRLRTKALADVIVSLNKYYQSVNRQFSANGKSSYEVLNAAYDIGTHQSLLANAEAVRLSNGWIYNLMVDGFAALD